MDYRYILVIVVGVVLIVLIPAAILIIGMRLQKSELKQSGYAPGWQVRCKKCNAVWDAGEVGIVRIGAASRGKATYGRCRNCRKRAWMAIEKKPEVGGAR